MFDVESLSNARGYGIYGYQQAYRKTVQVKGPEGQWHDLKKGPTAGDWG
jgi:hypothetical protein